MTAKEKLKAAIEELTEAEAAVALDLIVRRAGPTTLDELLANAPLDDEPWTDADDAAIAEADADRAAGAQPIPFDEIKRKYDLA